MAAFVDSYGQTHQVALNPLLYRQAAEAHMTVDAFINSQYSTNNDRDGSAFDQMVQSLGITMRTDRAQGLQASRLSDVLEGTLPGATATISNTAPTQGLSESRLIFPAAVLRALEDKLAQDLTTAAAAFDRMVGHTDTISGNEYRRIITNFDKPEQARNGATSQLARPQNMLLMTASERPGVVPTVSLGIEWADQVLQNTTIDRVTASIARHVAVQRNADAQNHTIALLNGDIDVGQGPIPAAYRHKASDYDSSITTNGKLTQEAWVKWLYDGNDYRTINWVVTDIDGALAIQNREGRPVVVGDDATSPRIDTAMRIANPLIPDTVNVFVTRHPDWPAGTIMGLSSAWAIQRVISLGSNYRGFNVDEIRRASTMRWDSGSVVYRLYDEAFSVLTLEA